MWDNAFIVNQTESTTVDLVAQLNVLASRLDNIPYLNDGGCGVVAAHVAKRLQHITKVRVAIFAYGQDIDEIRSYVRNTRSALEWSRSGLVVGHAMVEFLHNGEWWLFDSVGAVPDVDEVTLFGNHHLYKDGYLTIDEICALAANPYPWNNDFYRDLYIRKIRRRIDYFFKQLNS